MRDEARSWRGVTGWHSQDVTGLRKEHLKWTFWKVGLQTDWKSGSALEVIGHQVPVASKAQGFPLAAAQPHGGMGRLSWVEPGGPLTAARWRGGGPVPQVGNID